MTRPRRQPGKGALRECDALRECAAAPVECAAGPDRGARGAQVRGRMQQLKEALFAKVAAVLDPAARPAGAAVPGAVAAGRWRAVFDKGARLWSRSRGGGGGAGAGADARAELQRQLEDLHADIQGQIGAEARAACLLLGQ